MDNDVNEILDLLEEQTNSSIIKLNSNKIMEHKNNILQQIQITGPKLKTFHKKLKEYRYCSDMRDFVEGNYVRWIPLKDPSKIYLTNGGILVNVEIFESGVQIRVKNNQNRFFNIKFDEVLIFQKLSMQEKIIIKVLDLIDKS